MQSFVKGLSNYWVIFLHKTYLLFTTAQDGGTGIRECGGYRAAVWREHDGITMLFRYTPYVDRTDMSTV